VRSTQARGRLASSPFVVPLLAAAAVVGIARAQPEPGSAPVDQGRLEERHVIPPGAETSVGDILGSQESFPGGCRLEEGSIERTAVVATYKCSAGDVALQLVHPDDAPRGAVRTERFGVTVTRGTPPPGFLDAVIARIRDRESSFQWTVVNADAGAKSRPGIRMVGGILVALLALWALRRVAAARRTA